MVITLKFDLKLALFTAILISIGIAALMLAFPSVSIWTPSNSAEMASWVQAIGSIFAIAATWYISTVNDRKRQDSENRIAALEASTMYADLRNFHSSLAAMHAKILINCRNPIEISPQNTFGIVSEILSIALSPLSEQKNLVPVGNNYLSNYAEILRIIAILKSDAHIFAREIVRDKDFAIVVFEEIPELIVSAKKYCRITSKILKDFVEEQGISLDYPY